MAPPSIRLRRVVLAAGTGFGAYLLSPLAPGVAAEGGGLGAGGAAFAFNYTLVIGIALAFVFGFGLRDYIQKRMARARPSRPAP